MYTDDADVSSSHGCESWKSDLEDEDRFVYGAVNDLDGVWGT